MPNLQSEVQSAESATPAQPEPKEWRLTEPDPTEEFPVLCLFTTDDLPFFDE